MSPSAQPVTRHSFFTPRQHRTMTNGTVAPLSSLNSTMSPVCMTALVVVDLAVFATDDLCRHLRGLRLRAALASCQREEEQHREAHQFTPAAVNATSHSVMVIAPGEVVACR